MLPVKFRAWDIQQRKMWHWSSDDGDTGFWDNVSTFPDRYKLMQSTGILDTTGKNEVYEGDLVTDPWHWDEPHIIILPDDYYDFREYVLADEVTIIGNVWENPNILGAVND